MINVSAESADCVVIGGGPAGAACAIALHALARQARTSHQRRVILVERESFPRFKVCGCCFNGVGESILQSLGCEQILREGKAVPLRHWHAKFSGKSVTADLPTGWALSRQVLDSAMLSHARSQGVEVLQPAVAKLLDVEPDGSRVEVIGADQRRREIRTPIAVVATGLAGISLDTWLPWLKIPAGPVGVGAAFSTTSDQYHPGTIYMACSNSGYAGIVRLENGWIDVAAALYDPRGRHRGVSINERIASMLAEAGMPPLPELSNPSSCEAAGCGKISWKGTPKLQRQRQVAHHSLLAIGDAAGYVEPFTGEGMAWALTTGKLAAECIHEQLWQKRLDPVAVSENYKQRYHSSLNSRRFPCRFLTHTLRSEIGRRLIFASLRLCPWLAQPFIRTINSV